MDAKVKYHLYETAHSGIIPGQTVNLVPKTWTTRTVTDGVWMTNATLSALDFRDYFLANMIDAVDEDKKNHYVGKDGIVIDHEKRTISYDPIDGKYVFDNNSAMWCEPNSKFVYTKLNEDKDNRIKLVSGYINYELTPGVKYITATVDSSISSITGFSGSDSISSFSTDVNVVYVTNAKLYKNNITAMSAGETSAEPYKNEGSGSKWVVTGDSIKDGYREYWSATTESATLYTDGTSSISSSNIFDPTDRTNYSGGFIGGPNFISGDVDMVPSGVLFIY